jgi:hypothetical protein
MQFTCIVSLSPLSVIIYKFVKLIQKIMRIFFLQSKSSGYTCLTKKASVKISGVLVGKRRYTAYTQYAIYIHGV